MPVSSSDTLPTTPLQENARAAYRIPLFLPPSLTGRNITVLFAARLQDKVYKATQFSPPVTQFIKTRGGKKRHKGRMSGDRHTDTAWSTQNLAVRDKCRAGRRLLPHCYTTACPNPPQMMASDRRLISPLSSVPPLCSKFLPSWENHC